MAEEQKRSFFGSSKVQPKPKLALTCTVKEVKARPSNPDSDYDTIEVVIEPIRGSKGGVFPTMLYRPEQVREGFDFDAYTDYEANPDFAVIKPGKERTVGATFQMLYGMHVYPVIDTPTKGKNAGKRIADKVTTLMAIAGGTLADLEALTAAFVTRSDDKAKEEFKGTPEQVADVINGYLKARPAAPQLLYIAKQRQQDGVLKDGYDVDQWVGRLTQENFEAVSKRIQKSAAYEIGKRIVLGFDPKAK